MVDAISRGITWEEYFLQGTVPIQQIKQYEYAYALIVSQMHKLRNNPFCPQFTVEVIERSEITSSTAEGQTAEDGNN